MKVPPKRDFDMTWYEPSRPSDPAPDAQQVIADAPCPKCGHDDVTLRYCNGDHAWGALCRWNDPEHFHRRCARCRYEWRTDDVLDGKS